MGAQGRQELFFCVPPPKIPQRHLRMCEIIALSTGFSLVRTTLAASEYAAETERMGGGATLVVKGMERQQSQNSSVSYSINQRRRRKIGLPPWPRGHGCRRTNRIYQRRRKKFGQPTTQLATTQKTDDFSTTLSARPGLDDDDGNNKRVATIFELDDEITKGRMIFECFEMILRELRGFISPQYSARLRPWARFLSQKPHWYPQDILQEARLLQEQPRQSRFQLSVALARWETANTKRRSEIIPNRSEIIPNRSKIIPNRPASTWKDAVLRQSLDLTLGLRQLLKEVPSLRETLKSLKTDDTKTRGLTPTAIERETNYIVQTCWNRLDLLWEALKTSKLLVARSRSRRRGRNAAGTSGLGSYDYDDRGPYYDYIRLKMDTEKYDDDGEKHCLKTSAQDHHHHRKDRRRGGGGRGFLDFFEEQLPRLPETDEEWLLERQTVDIIVYTRAMVDLAASSREKISMALDNLISEFRLQGRRGGGQQEDIKEQLTDLCQFIIEHNPRRHDDERTSSVPHPRSSGCGMQACHFVSARSHNDSDQQLQQRALAILRAKWPECVLPKAVDAAVEFIQSARKNQERCWGYCPCTHSALRKLSGDSLTSSIPTVFSAAVSQTEFTKRVSLYMQNAFNEFRKSPAFACLAPSQKKVLSDSLTLVGEALKLIKESRIK